MKNRKGSKEMQEETYHVISINTDDEVLVASVTKAELTHMLNCRSDENIVFLDQSDADIGEDPKNWLDHIPTHEVATAMLIIKGGKVITPEITKKEIEYAVE